MKTIKIPNIMGKTWEQAKGEVYQTLVYLIQRLRTTGLQEEENAVDIATSTATIPENLDDLADVDVAGAANKSTIRLNTASGLWEDVLLSFANLSDVDMDPAPNDGDVPQYEAASSTWLPVAPVESLDDLSDVALSSPTNGQVLQFYRPSGWLITLDNQNFYFQEAARAEQTAIVTPGTYATGADLATELTSDMNACIVDNTYTVTYNGGTGKFTVTRTAGAKQFKILSTGTAKLDDSIGFDAGNWDSFGTTFTGTNARTGDTLPGEWRDATLSLVAALDDLSDVSAASPTNGDLIQFNSGSGLWGKVAIASFWSTTGWHLKDAGIVDATPFSLFTVTKLAALDAVALSIEFWGYAYDATDISTCVGKIQHTDLFRSGAWGATAFPTLVGVDDYELRIVSSGGTVAPSFTVTASGDDLTIKATLTKAGGWTPSFKFRYRVSMATPHVPSFAF